MNYKRILKITLLIIVISMILILIIHIIKKNNRQKLQNEIIENWITEENIENAEETQEEFSDNAIGKLKIPIIGVDAEIADGTDLTTLATYIGHFKESSLWDGNVALASHNRGSNAHYFENINKLQKGDLIIYVTRWGTKKYKVESIEKIKETDWSIIEQTDNNILTLVTCIKEQRDKRLCVKAVEI